ncbi:hypothetical protein AABB24_030006, partial [Solanum stoloniferum]
KQTKQNKKESKKMDRRILGLSFLTLMICSLLVTKTWADEDKNPEEAAANKNSNPAAVGATPTEPKNDDSDAHDSDENYVGAGGFNGQEDQFGPEIVVVGH